MPCVRVVQCGLELSHGVMGAQGRGGAGLPGRVSSQALLCLPACSPAPGRALPLQSVAACVCAVRAQVAQAAEVPLPEDEEEEEQQQAGVPAAEVAERAGKRSRASAVAVHHSCSASACPQLGSMSVRLCARARSPRCVPLPAPPCVAHLQAPHPRHCRCALQLLCDPAQCFPASHFPPAAAAAQAVLW